MNYANRLIPCCTAACEVVNVPEYALIRQYWIVTPVRGHLWFWGAYSSLTDAEKCLEGEQFIVANRSEQKEEKA